MRLIDADALIDRMYHEAFENDESYNETNPMARWDSGLWIRYKMFENAIDEQPTIEPKHGEWIPCTKEGLALTELMRREGKKWYGYRCTNCNFIYKGNALTESRYCQGCGARMKGADDE